MTYEYFLNNVMYTPLRRAATRRDAAVASTCCTLVFEQITDVDRRLFRKMISPRPLINSGVMILLNGRHLPMQSEGWLLVALRQT